MVSLKIAQVVSTYPPYRGGMGKIAFEYTNYLRERGHNVHVFTPAYKSVKDTEKHIHRIPSHLHVGNASVTPSLYNRLAGFDIVHLHYPFFGGAEPVIVRKAIKKEQGLVITYHMDAVADGAKGMMFTAHKKLLMPWIMGRADKILVSSRDYAATCALKKLDDIQDKIEIHPFGVDLNKFHPGSEDELKTSLGIRPDMPVILFVGGLDRAHHFKGLPVLLDALKEMEQYAWHAVIVGEGEMRASFEATVKAHRLGDKITFLGPVDDEMLPKWYRASDMLCFPSTERAEAFGLVALEAAASGIPTIASDLPGVRSVVLNGETGFLVPPKHVDELRKALVLLLEQVDLRERLGLSGRKRAESEFAWEPLICKLENTYTKILNPKS
ncbi:MAG: glycosyltransferase family 4 protein [Patescibacteria group bacterium]